MKKRFVSFLLVLALCMGLSVPALADDPYGPRDVGFYVAEKFYSFDEPASGDGWSYDGNYTMTLSGIQSTYGETEYGVKLDWIQLNNPKKDFTFVVKDGTENNVGNIEIIYGGGFSIKDSQRKAVTFTGSGTLHCKAVNLDKVTFRNVTLKAEEGFSCWGLTMESGSIQAANFSMGHTGTTLEGMYSLTGGTIELVGSKTSAYYSGVLRVDGLEEAKVREVIGMFQDRSGKALQAEIKENTVYGGYYAFAKENGSDEYATYGIWKGSANTAPGATGFADVSAGDYYAAPVDWAVGQGITNGTSNTTFSPNDTCTKGQIITFLWRAAGSPEPQKAVPFGDVAADAYYAKATAWAAENGMASGDTFAPNAPCTREMAVEFMWKHAGSPEAAQAGFADASSEAVDWAVAQGVTNGTSDTTFSPDNICTRGQIVTFLYRAFA
ncbi:MAG TPA: S-layer homology domain-containing protein [Firmicutes bacterium]|nr:S-layer homology domain-containing protein [Bacillota bacterium]